MNWYDTRNAEIYAAYLESDRTRKARLEIAARWLLDHEQVGDIIRQVDRRVNGGVTRRNYKEK